jgi:hypothetical protein
VAQKESGLWIEIEVWTSSSIGIQNYSVGLQRVPCVVDRSVNLTELDLNLSGAKCEVTHVKRFGHIFDSFFALPNKRWWREMDIVELSMIQDDKNSRDCPILLLSISIFKTLRTLIKKEKRRIVLIVSFVLLD